MISSYPHQNQNQNRVRKQMMFEISSVIIDNTNIRANAIKRYVLFADEFLYEIILINPPDFTNKQHNPIINPDTTKINRE